MRMLLFLITFAFGFVVFTKECDRKPFYRDRERGWFWKEVCVEEKEEKEQKKVVKIPWDRLDSMSVEEIKRLREEVQYTAVMNPTPENVREFLRFNLWLMKKASRFMETGMMVAMLDPEIAEYTGKRPTSSFARFVKVEVKEKERIERIRRNLDRFGLIVVVEKTCPYCHELARVINRNVKPLGVSVLFVERSERPRFAHRLGVRMVPDTFLVWREGDAPYFFRIATGLVAGSTLLERIDFVLRYIEEGRIDELKTLAVKIR